MMVPWENPKVCKDREESKVTGGCSFFLHHPKGKVLIAQITAENEKLLQERRRLLQKISDQDESPWSLRSGIPSLQSR